jgi:hypothetical protein
MILSRRWFGICAILLLSGCVQSAGVLPQSRDTPFVLDVPDTATRTTVARSQLPEGPPPVPRPPDRVPVDPPKQPAGPTPAIAPPPSTSAAAQPVGVSGSSGPQATVRVRAWVNGKGAIFDDEVWNEVNPVLRRMSPGQRDDERAKLYAKVLEALIDSELIYQDALRKLEKNPKLLEKVKTSSLKETEKRIASNLKIMNLNNLHELEQVLLLQGTSIQTVRRQMEREYIATEYLKMRIIPALQKVGHEEIREYYDQHLNEFQTVERVKWQNIFIAAAKFASPAQAREFAQQVMNRWRAGEDLAKLLEYDDGDSRFRQGEGAGEIKGDIKPHELEPYLLAMHDGEFGPLVELSTGVHLFRVVKHDRAGVMPFDEKTQTMISNKLKNEVVDQERRRMVRELREWAVIEIDRN